MDPYLSPIDKLRLELDENYGANVAVFEEKKMFVGIGRVMRADGSVNSELQPHFDSLPPDFFPLDGQFSANVYLKVPESGGELEVWNVPPIPANEIVDSDPNKDWRKELPNSIKIKPNVGDLIMINTRRAHAIRRFDEGIRVTIQCFIGYKKDKPLYLWN